MRYYLLFVLFIWLGSIQAQTPSAFISHNGVSNITIDGKLFSGGSSGAAIHLKNCSNVTITNCRFENMAGVIGVQLENCSNIEVGNCSFDLFRTGVYAIGSQGINVHCNDFKDIGGSKPRGQIVQFNGCSGSGNRVNYNTLDHTFGVGYPEDLINMYASSGTVNDPLQIIGNHLRGGGPSKSGGGIMVGDNDGHDIIVKDNILVDPGQYGIGCPAGKNIRIENNKVYGKQQSFTNVGIYVGLASEIDAGHECLASTISVIGNEVNWTNKSGNKAGFWNCSCCSGIENSGNNFSASFGDEILPDNIELNASCGTGGDQTSGGGETNAVTYDCYYGEDFETTPIETFADGDYYWPYYQYFKKDPDLTEFHKRFQIHEENGNKFMRIIKEYGDIDKDANPNLNPRTEVRLRNPDQWDIPAESEQYFAISTRLTDPESVNLRAEFFQIMGRKGGISPPLQMEVRDGVYKARYYDVDNDWKKPTTIKSGFENPVDDYGKWVKWELYYRLSTDNSKGYFRLYKDGELVWERNAANKSTSHSDDHWLQFGCYVNNGADAVMQIEFDDICLAAQSSVSQNQSPEVSFVSPVIQSFEEGSDLGVTVDASDDDGEISTVELYFDDELVRSEGLAPYEWGTDNAGQDDALLNNLTAGQHVLKAIAYDDQGAASTVEMTIEVVEQGVSLWSVIDDAYLQGGAGNNNELLRVEHANRTSYLKFEVGEFEQPLISATLELTVGEDAGEGTIRIYQGSHNNWTENDVSSANAPSVSSEIITLTGTFAAGQTYSFDVTSLFMFGGSHSLVVEMDAGGNDVSFMSSETDQPPKLRLKQSSDLTTSNNIPETQLVDIWPNPGKEVLQLRGVGGFDQLTITSITGQLVLDQILDGHAVTIPTSELNPGVYYLTLNASSQQQIYRWVKT